ncbi:PRC-barrel domain containing protein [Streptomyces sp. RKAG293]|uniref:PRC-barrel domain containing protein n=1 Tax=Streptomyces sp. RKAG293 TaxID=2893403 RepID=UPI002033AF9D|nr:PRC-barrel domain containing protein [Streptomyces sp. RKAG293]MCM2416992.1 PRC-barrel domain containing protein [Streptomyces sp. RKAG293]
MSDNIWGYGATSGYQAEADVTGYKVEATDGHIGKVDKHSDEVGAAYLVVDTGVWIFGKSVLLPAGTVSRVDHENRTVFVARSKGEIKDAPEFDKDKHPGDAGYHQQVGGYYGSPLD